MGNMDNHERMRADAALGMTTDYGYPGARLNCARHVMSLLAELEEAESLLAAARGDWSGVRKIAGIES